MRTFYEEWKILESPNLAVSTAEIQGKDEIRQLRLTISPDFPIAAFFSLSFTHHTAILSNIKSYEERKFYIQFAVDYKVKCEDLEQLMKDDLYNHQGSLPNNFRRTIPDQLQAYRAITMFKDEYLLDYINTEELFVRDKDRDERVIEQSIINNVKDFIMTFGRDFTFVGNQYHLVRISPKWYRCIGLLVPCGAEAWYRTYRFDGTGTKVPIYTLSKGALRTVPHGTLR